MAFNAIEPWTFVSILVLTFSLFLVITGAFTAYFGSGKSRKIGGGLLGGGFAFGIGWAYFGGIAKVIPLPASLLTVMVQSVVVIAAAALGAMAAIGLFLLAIMKS
jgi:hypothetical protein